MEERIQLLQQQLRERGSALLNADPMAQNLMGRLAELEMIANDTSGNDKDGLSVVQGGKEAPEADKKGAKGG